MGQSLSVRGQLVRGTAFGRTIRRVLPRLPQGAAQVHSSRILASAGAPTGHDPIARRLAKTRTMRDRLRPLPLSSTQETNMLLEQIKTPGLSHLSYLIGSGGKEAVIDPLSDCACYVEMARADGLEITHIFETHQHENQATRA